MYEMLSELIFSTMISEFENPLSKQTLEELSIQLKGLFNSEDYWNIRSKNNDT
jgi:hypothetical protein